MPKGIRTERIIGQVAAIEFHEARKRLGDVIAWNITRGPDRFVARPQCTVPWGPAIRLEATTLEDLRNKIPPGLSLYPGDEFIVEVWI